jgi:hypothetical protein
VINNDSVKLLADYTPTILVAILESGSTVIGVTVSVGIVLLSHAEHVQYVDL